MKRALWIVAAVVVVAGGIAIWRARGRQPPIRPAFRTAHAERRDIVQEVRVTGTVRPRRMVDVGTQVTGRIVALPVDFNSAVQAGDVIAQIDPAVYAAALARDEALLASSQASLAQTQARLRLAERTLERARDLAARQMIPVAEFDQALADRDVLAAQLGMAQAAIRQAEASVSQARANVEYTTIRAPVAGVIVARAVDEGQTVVSSMAAQNLFSIAEDMRRIQVVASVPEADIGRIRVGQRVTFTVDAHDTVFTGAVTQVRLAAATVQNVVTYPVIVEAANPDGLLLPGMTANLACEVARAAHVLVVPNAALRFTPAEATPAGGSDGRRRGGARVWRLDAEGRPEAVYVQVGLNDGSASQLLDADELEGAELLVGVASAASGAGEGGVRNPFAPPMPSRRLFGGGRPPR